MQSSVQFGGVLNIQPVDEANTEYTTVHLRINGVSKDVRVPVPFLNNNNNTSKIPTAEGSTKTGLSDPSGLDSTETDVIGSPISQEQGGNHVSSTSSVSASGPQVSKRRLSSVDVISADRSVLNNVIVIAPDDEGDQLELCASIQKPIQTAPAGGGGGPVRTDSAAVRAPRRQLDVSGRQPSTIQTVPDSGKSLTSPVVVQSAVSTEASGDGRDKATYVMVTSSKPEGHLFFVLGASPSTVMGQALPVVTDSSSLARASSGQQTELCITSVRSLHPAAVTAPVNDENASDSNRSPGFSAPAKGFLHRIFTDIQNPITGTNKKRRGSDPDGAASGAVGQKAPSTGKKRVRKKRKSDGDDGVQRDKRIKEEWFGGFKENPLLRVHVQKLDLGPRFRSCKVDRLQQHLASRRRAKKYERNKTCVDLDQNSNRLTEEENKKPTDSQPRSDQPSKDTNPKLIMIKTSVGRYLLPVVPGLTVDGLVRSLKSGALKLPPVKTDKSLSALSKTGGEPSWKPTCQRSLLKTEGPSGRGERGQTPGVRPIIVVNSSTAKDRLTFVVKSTPSQTSSVNTCKHGLETSRPQDTRPQTSQVSDTSKHGLDTSRPQDTRPQTSQVSDTSKHGLDTSRPQDTRPQTSQVSDTSKHGLNTSRPQDTRPQTSQVSDTSKHGLETSRPQDTRPQTSQVSDTSKHGLETSRPQDTRPQTSQVSDTTDCGQVSADFRSYTHAISLTSTERIRLLKEKLKQQQAAVEKARLQRQRTRELLKDMTSVV